MKISVIITAFNVEKYLPKAVESFLQQDYQNKELLIVDAISTDGTHGIIEGYCKEYPQFIKWIKEKDTGISNARNIALKHVKGDLVGFLGADDVLHKDFFAYMQYYIAMHDNFDVVYFNSYCMGTSFGFGFSANIAMTKRNLIKHCPIGSGESFYYRKAIFDTHRFNEDNRYCMDYEFNMELVTEKKPDGGQYLFYPINIPAVFNLHRGDNISSESADKQRLETIAVQIKYAKNAVEKFRILWRGKKKIWKHRALFSLISKNI